MQSITQRTVRALYRVVTRFRLRPKHLVVGHQGEADAYFYLKRLGYRFVAANFRAPHDRGEIDLIGWDGGTLCFIEVKTRTDDSFAPLSTAVDAGKRKHILAVAKRYLRRIATDQRPPCRFDILSVVPTENGTPEFTLRKGAFTWGTDSRRRRHVREFVDWRNRRR